MTIYIHFLNNEQPPIQLHNVESVSDEGVNAVRILMQFSDEQPIYENVSHIAVQPEKE